MTLASGLLVSFIDERLRSELWDRIAARLSEGDRLVTRRQFCAAIEAAYRDFTGQTPSADVRANLAQMVEEVHSLEPESYLAPGVQNAVMQAFERGIYRLDWDVLMVKSRGPYALQCFLGRDRMRHFFDEIRLDPGLIDLSACVRHGVACAHPAGTDASRHRASHPAGRPTPAQAASPSPPAQGDSLDRGLLATFVAAAGRIGLDEELVRQRMLDQDQHRAVLLAAQLERAPADLPIYLADGLLSEAEADQYSALRSVDDRLAASAISAAEAGQQRDALLDANARRALARKMELAVSGPVDCLQVFDALKRIPPQYDELLRLLIRHREHVISSDSGGDRTPLLSELLGDTALLEQAGALMGRRDPELRLLSARLPPYNQVAPRKLEAIDDLQIEESFIDDLRRMGSAQYGERLRATDADLRRRAADAIRSLILLLDYLVEPTPFRRKVCLLQVNRLLQELTPEIETVYGSIAELTEARRTAARLVRQRLDRAFGEASPEEESAARRRGQALLMTVEQKVAAQRPAAPEAPQADGEPGDDEAQPVEELSQIEQTRGAQLVRVEVRTGGRRRMVPAAIMPDPEDSRRFVMASRDPGTGGLVAQERRGRRRYVDRKPDGTWRALTG